MYRYNIYTYNLTGSVWREKKSVKHNIYNRLNVVGERLGRECGKKKKTTRRTKSLRGGTSVETRFYTHFSEGPPPPTPSCAHQMFVNNLRRTASEGTRRAHQVILRRFALLYDIKLLLLLSYIVFNGRAVPHTLFIVQGVIRGARSTPSAAIWPSKRENLEFFPYALNSNRSRNDAFAMRNHFWPDF